MNAIIISDEDCVSMAKPCGTGGQNLDAVTNADAPVQEVPPQIFKLNVVCFEAVTEWLCLKDLLAFGRTCKRLQAVAGHIFNETYPAARVICLNDGIYFDNVKMNGFCDYIRNMKIEDDELGCFHFVDSHSFESIKCIQITEINLTDEKIACIKKILNIAEVVEVKECTLDGEFYAKFLQFCQSMTRLSVRPCDEPYYFEYDSDSDSDDESSDIVIGTNNNWLLHKYPMLEHFELTKSGRFSTPRVELKIFLEQNPNIRHFATGGDFDWSDAANLKLDVFAIDCDENFDLRALLIANIVHEMSKMNGSTQFYERLHIYGHWISVERQLQHMVSKLEKLYLHRTWTDSFSIGNLKEIRIECDMKCLDGMNVREMNMIANGLINIEQVSLVDATLVYISKFIRGSVKLHKLRIENFNRTELSTNGMVLDLSTWNSERKQLDRARKVMIYVEEDVFLTTKWATRKTNYSLIDLKRNESRDWSHDFGYD